MSVEIKRGRRFPDGWEHKEAQEIGPYPTWNQWKQQVLEKFGDLVDGNRDVETFFHEFYVLRRMYQKTGILDRERIENLWKKIEEKIPNFEEKYGGIALFIVEHTEPGKIKTRK